MLLPEHVEDAMADIITVLHGVTLAEMNMMTVSELMQWRERARVRNQPAEND